MTTNRTYPLVILSIPVLGILVVNFLIFRDYSKYQRLENEGVTNDARVTGIGTDSLGNYYLHIQYVAPYNTGRKLYYKDFELEKEFGVELFGSQPERIAIRYLPDDPEFVFIEGEIPDQTYRIILLIGVWLIMISILAYTARTFRTG